MSKVIKKITRVFVSGKPYKLIALFVLAFTLIAVLIGLRIRRYNQKLYDNALSLYENGKYDEAVEILDSLDFKDSSQKSNHIKQEKKNSEEQELYTKAINLYNIKAYSDAVVLFDKLGNYKDSEEYADKCNKIIIDRKENAYEKAVNDFEDEQYQNAYATFSLLENYKDSTSYLERCINSIERLSHAHTVYGGIRYCLGINNNYEMLFSGDDYTDDGISDNDIDPKRIKNVISVAGKDGLVLGLKKDGKVMCTGKSEVYDINIDAWDNLEILSIDAGEQFVIALDTEHRLHCLGRNDENQYDCQSWKNISKFSSGKLHIAALDEKGKIYISGNASKKQLEEIKKESKMWDGVVDIAAGGSDLSHYFTAGLRKDGKVVVCGNVDAINRDIQKDEDDWNDIIMIAAGDEHLVGLRSDGTVVTAGNDSTIDYEGQPKYEKIYNWKDIIYITAGSGATYALDKRGKIYAAGNEKQGQLGSREWKDVMLPYDGKL